MRVFWKTMSGCLLAMTLVFAHGATQAASHRAKDELTAQEAAARVQRQTGGQALGVKVDSVDGRKVYRVRVLTRDGRVREVTVNAGSSGNQ